MLRASSGIPRSAHHLGSGLRSRGVKRERLVHSATGAAFVPAAWKRPRLPWNAHAVHVPADVDAAVRDRLRAAEVPVGKVAPGARPARAGLVVDDEPLAVSFLTHPLHLLPELAARQARHRARSFGPDLAFRPGARVPGLDGRQEDHAEGLHEAAGSPPVQAVDQVAAARACVSGGLLPDTPFVQSPRQPWRGQARTLQVALRSLRARSPEMVQKWHTAKSDSLGVDYPARVVLTTRRCFALRQI